jgi:CheY-like chemotaxis protein
MAEVLIVDDEADAREPLGRFLDKVGHVARVASGGEEGLSQILAKIPDVVILDLLMPKVTGTDLLATLRSYHRFHALPVVVLTALSNTPTLERVRKLGVHSILQKTKATFEDVRKALEAAVRARA